MESDSLLHPLTAIEAEAARAQRERERFGVDDAIPVPPVADLAKYVNEQFDLFKRHRKSAGIDDELIACLRALNRTYDEDKKTAIQATGGSDIYMGVTGLKARAAISWLLDIFSNEQDKTWGIRPTPVPTLAPNDMQAIAMHAMQTVQQLADQGQQLTPDQMIAFKDKLEEDVKAAVVKEANDKAEAMELAIHDQLVEGGWAEAFLMFVMDLVNTKAGILKGPVIRMRTRKQWVVDPNYPEQASMQVVREPIPTFERVSPFNAYPSPTAVDFTGDFIETQRLTKSALSDLVGMVNYDSVAITAVLDDFEKDAEPSMEPVDVDREELENKNTTERRTMRDSVEAREAWLCVSGQTLLDDGREQGPNGEPVVATAVYDICAIVIGDRTIYFDYNRDPLRRKPYYKMGWSIRPGSFWYDCVYDLMKELQDLANSSMRSLVNNLAVSSGPQVWISDIGRLPQGEDITQVVPFKIWQFLNKSNSNVPPVQFFQPDSNAPTLLSVYDRAVEMTDDWTGIPAYSYGNDQVAGAGRTASGLSMLMSNAAKGIKRVILSIDKFVIKPLIERMYDWNMENNPDPSIKGDLRVEATGAVAIMVKEQMSERRLEFLQATNNPTDFQIMGVEGRATVLREAAKSLEISGQNVVMDEVEIERKINEQQQQAMEMQQQETQLKASEIQANVQLKQAELQLKQQELQLKAGELQGVTAPVAQAKVAQMRAQSDDAAIKNYLTMQKNEQDARIKEKQGAAKTKPR